MNNSWGNSGQTPNNNDWGNPNNFNDGYNSPRPVRNSEQASRIVNSCNKLAKAYIILFFLFVFCAILAIVFTSLSVEVVYSSSYYGYSSSDVRTNEGMALAAVVMIVFLVIFVISFEIIGIILLVKTSALKEYYPETGSLWILFLIGLFIGITALIGAFMTLSSSKRIIKNSSNSTYQDYAQDQPTKY
ncbi:MAG: hypothetical protein HDR31_00045 [Mycoplasma sp.]|nr:hypothetical protein [Mycoplasma sp.]